jgi:predicted PurR-regulated permease PerM
MVSSLIPVIGTYLAGALPIVIALGVGVGDAIWVLVAVVVYQQVENYLVAPRITAHTLSLHPAMAFVSVLIGGRCSGAGGALLALPAAAIVAALQRLGERHEVVEHDLLQTRSGSGERDAPPPAD